jgi:hypothetical protein
LHETTRHDTKQHDTRTLVVVAVVVALLAHAKVLAPLGDVRGDLAVGLAAEELQRLDVFFCFFFVDDEGERRGARRRRLAAT